MKSFIAMMPLFFLVQAYAADKVAATGGTPAAGGPTHRYLIERTFPKGALEGLDEATKQKVNANNATVGVRWVQSFANADKTKTFCVYEGPNEASIRKAAKLNALPVDRITEVPVDLDAGHPAHAVPVSSPAPSGKQRRYLVERTFAPGALDGLDAAGKVKVNSTNDKFGVTWVKSYANANRTKTYCLYEGPSEVAVRQAAKANGIPVDRVMEVPVTLMPAL
jgi:hypothetical protein